MRIGWLVFLGSLAAGFLPCGHAEDFAQLAARCAPEVHPATLAAVVKKESAFDPMVIGVNAKPHYALHPKSIDAAVSSARELIGSGVSVDLGLGQINAHNLQRLGLTLSNAFEPCRNLAASARLLTDSYQRFRAAGMDSGSALDAAVSAYNTGSGDSGVVNGYVGNVKVIANGGQYQVPAIGIADIAPTSPSAPSLTAVELTSRVSTPAANSASWDVFGDASASTDNFVVQPKQGNNEEHDATDPTPADGAPGSRAQRMVSGGGTASQPTDGPVVLFAEPSAAPAGRPPAPS